MLDVMIILLILLQIKHWYVDFHLQNEEEIACKGIYGNCLGINHSIKHGVGTFICLLLVTGFTNVLYTIVLSFLNFVLHYHTDYMKMNYGNTDGESKKFWRHLGLGQMIHQLTYLLIAYLALNTFTQY
jgi:hypothetical protein